MAKVTPNYSEAAEYLPLEEGEYSCEILSCEAKVSKQGNRYLNWKLKTLTGNSLYYTTVIEGRGAGMLKHFLKCALGNYDQGEFDTDELIHRMVNMYLTVKEVETDRGKSRYFEVKEVMPFKDLIDPDDHDNSGGDIF